MTEDVNDRAPSPHSFAVSQDSWKSPPASGWVTCVEEQLTCEPNRLNCTDSTVTPAAGVKTNGVAPVTEPPSAGVVIAPGTPCSTTTGAVAVPVSPVASVPAASMV